jgi:hypothetical protein
MHPNTKIDPFGLWTTGVGVGYTIDFFSQSFLIVSDGNGGKDIQRTTTHLMFPGIRNNNTGRMREYLKR